MKVRTSAVTFLPLVAFCGVAGVALGQNGSAGTPPMTQALCDAGIQAIADLFDGSAADGDLPRVSVSADGFCRIDGNDPALDGADYETLEWWAPDIQRISDGVPPPQLSIALRGFPRSERGVASGMPQTDLSLSYRHDAGTRTLTLDEIRLDQGDAALLEASATVSGVDFSSPAGLQLSGGSFRINRISATLTLDGGFETFVLPMIAGWLYGEGITSAGGLEAALSQLDTTQLPEDSRAALRRFGAALPEARGTLTLDVTSDRGIGALQVGAAANRLQAMSDADTTDLLLGEGVALLLSGAAITATWQPAP